MYLTDYLPHYNIELFLSFSYFQTPPCSMAFLRTSLHYYVNVKVFIENWLYMKAMHLFSDVRYSLSVSFFRSSSCILNMMLHCSQNGKKSFKRIISFCNDHGFPLDL